MGGIKGESGGNLSWDGDFCEVKNRGINIEENNRWDGEISGENREPYEKILTLGKGIK